VHRGGQIRTGFYQIHKEHVEQLKLLNDYLTDARSLPCTINSPIWRKVVILAETDRPVFIFQDVNRFRQKREAATRLELEVHDPIPPRGGSLLSGGGGVTHLEALDTGKITTLMSAFNLRRNWPQKMVSKIARCLSQLTESDIA